LCQILQEVRDAKFGLAGRWPLAQAFDAQLDRMGLLGGAPALALLRSLGEGFGFTSVTCAGQRPDPKHFGVNRPLSMR
jgi:hypothetical protein